MPKNFIKSKSVAGGPNASGPKYRTPDHFKVSVFGGSKAKVTPPRVKFNPAQFKVQHKG
jgi:hypothetical protein